MLCARLTHPPAVGDGFARAGADSGSCDQANRTADNGPGQTAEQTIDDRIRNAAA